MPSLSALRKMDFSSAADKGLQAFGVFFLFVFLRNKEKWFGLKVSSPLFGHRNAFRSRWLAESPVWEEESRSGGEQERQGKQDPLHDFF